MVLGMIIGKVLERESALLVRGGGSVGSRRDCWGREVGCLGVGLLHSHRIDHLLRGWELQGWFLVAGIV